MEAVGFVASVVGLIQITAKLTSVTYGYIGAYKQAPDHLRDLVAELNSLQQVLVILQSYSAQPSSALEGLLENDGPLEKCFQELQSLFSELKLKGKKDRILWPLKQKDTIEHIHRIERQKNLFNLAINIDNLSMSKVIEENVRDTNIAVAALRKSIQAKQIAKKNKEVLDWLYPQKIDEKHIEISSRRQDNTGKWLLGTQEFQALIKEQAKSRLLWGYGIPGAGKSFLSSAVIDHLRAEAPTEDYGIAYIYFDYKEQLRQNSGNVLASLVRQLTNQIPHIPIEVEELYKKVQLDPHRTRPTVEELYGTLLATLKFFTRVFFVFDALDECDKTQRVHLLPLFHRMGKSGINCFLTSRQYPEDIQYSLRDAPSIELSAKKEDIAIYIESRINENLRASRLVREGKCKDRIISEILDCSKGMFLLVRFNMEYICQQTTTNQLLKALEKLKSSSTGEMRPLYPTYDRVMGNILKQGPDSANLALKILSWLVKANRTLTVDEIRVAVSVEPHRYELGELDLPHKETLLEVCASLVTIDDNSNTIHLAHYTVQEYLVENAKLPTDVDLQLAMACTTFLSFDNIFAEGALKNEDSFKSRLESHPFLSYAAEQLSFHLESCGDNGEEGPLTNMILRFLQEQPGNVSSYLQISRIQLLGERMFSESFANIPPPLHVASIIGYRAAVRELLREGADQSIRDDNGMTALHTAVGWGRDAVVKLLLEKGADYTTPDSCGWTALHIAANQGQLESTRLLLEKGADHSIKNNEGHTALHKAAYAGQDEVARLLLDSGIDHSIRDKKGQTALHIAAGGGGALSGSETIVRLLLDKGADHSITDNEGQTPLHTLSSRGFVDVARILLEKGADYSIQNNRGETPLHISVNWSHDDLAILLLDKGADHSTLDNDGQTVLHTAVRWSTKKSTETFVRLLLQKGADHSIPDKRGQTVLHLAAWTGEEEVVKYLFDKGADSSIQDNEGQTVLHKAVSQGNNAVIKYFLDKGVDYSILDNRGMTALDLALDCGFEGAVELLLSKGAEFSVPHQDWREMVRIASLKREGEIVIHKHYPSTQLKLWGFSFFFMLKSFLVGLVTIFCFIYFWLF